MVRSVRIGPSTVGDGHPCFLVAEAGSNHNGDIRQAKRLIETAAAAGADAVKFQLFRADQLYPRTAGRSDYLKQDRSIYEIIAEMEMPYEWVPELAAHARGQGILFLASVFDEESAEILLPHVPAFKVASYEMTHLPLVRTLARLQKPVIIATGAATLEEVRETVEAFRATGNEDLILMQCTASYPAPPESLNVRALVTLRETFGVPTGLSDHSRDPLVGPLSAVALGAHLIEKHFTLSNRLPGPDHGFAVEPDELALMVQKIRRVEQSLGSGVKAVHPVEQELRAFARRQVFAVRPIGSGELFSRQNTAILRCGKNNGGLPPKEYDQLLGRAAARSIPEGSPIRQEDCVFRRAAAIGGVALRPARLQDSAALWRWRNEEETRRVSFDTEPIPYERHERWLREKLGRPESRILIVQAPEGGEVGYVRLRLEGDSAEISISIDAGQRGKGYGSAAVKAAADQILQEGPIRRITALIKNRNAASVGAFERAGFTRVGTRVVSGSQVLEMVRTG